MAAVWIALGAAMILFTLRDIFHELFHPSGTGSMSGWLMQTGWQMFRRVSSRRPDRMRLAGPTIMLLVISGWTTILVVGWALIIWPYLPEGFLLSAGLEPSDNNGFLDALYLSLVTLATLGYGDLTPLSTPFRILLPMEALVGFALLTVSISWLLSLYPILSQRRSLANQIWLLRAAEDDSGLSLTEPRTNPEEILSHLASQVTSVRSGLTQFPISYYFHAGDEKNALSRTLPELIPVIRRLETPQTPEPLRFRAAVLGGAIDDLAVTLADRFLDLPPSTPTEKILEAYARDHLYATRDNPASRES